MLDEGFLIRCNVAEQAACKGLENIVLCSMQVLLPWTVLHTVGIWWFLQSSMPT